MSRAPVVGATCDAREAGDEQCHLCGDVAVPGRVLEVNEATRTAFVMIGGERVSVALDLVEARVGDDVLVHLGFAIERLEHA
jgi:hydrogenase maturation factor